MKLIKISTDMELSVHEFPQGTYTEQNEVLRNLIGADCRLYEHVRPMRLYKELHHVESPTKTPGQCVCMLIDEESLLKEQLTPNLIGSYLYEADKHGIPILGNILFVGEEWGSDGIDFCGIEDSTFTNLELQLHNMIMAMKATMEVVK